MFLNLTCHDMGKQLKGVYVVPHHVLHPIHGGFCMPRHGGIHKSGLPFAQYQNSQYIYQQKKNCIIKPSIPLFILLHPHIPIGSTFCIFLLLYHGNVIKQNSWIMLSY